VLFYSAAYIGELYKRSFSVVPLEPKGRAALEAMGSRLGSRALLWSALLALVANFALPFAIKNKSTASADEVAVAKTKTKFLDRFRCHLATLWAASHVLFFICMEGTK
jgi:solute carrier family 45, member 1/2/4